MSDSDAPPPGTELTLYRTERGTRIDVRLDGGTVWLTQAQMAELFQTSVPNVNTHLAAIYDEGELEQAATIKSYLIVRQEGSRQVRRSVQHYNLEAILAVGYRVRSARGTQFRQWATARLREYLEKGFALDDERLRNPPGPNVPDYFNELLRRVLDNPGTISRDDAEHRAHAEYDKYQERRRIEAEETAEREHLEEMQRTIQSLPRSTSRKAE